MDKKLVIDNRSNSTVEIHTLNFRKSAIHDDFGLWMCLIVRSNRSFSGMDIKRDLTNLPQKLRKFKFYAISHMYEGAGFHYSPQSGFRNMNPGDCIITLPDVEHMYGACDNPEHLPYVEDNICFAGPLADNLCRSGVLQTQIVNLGTERLLLPIMEKALDPSRDAQIEANLMLIEFLSSLYRNKLQSSESTLTQKFALLTREIQRNPSRWWSVKEMAEYCNICESYFRSAFQKHTGLAPKLYVDKIKMGIAIEKLMQNKVKIYELAQLLGYVDQYHFSRRFKQIIGLSPQQYRLNK